MLYSKEQFAALITGREYPFSLTKEEVADANASGLVVLYGSSDDLAEFEGAINDEVGAGSRPILLRKSGPFTPPDEDETEVLEKFGVLKYVNQDAEAIKPHWDSGGYSWTYETTIPHSTFEVVEDGDKYCRGIVFDLASLKA